MRREKKAGRKRKEAKQAASPFLEDEKKDKEAKERGTFVWE